MNYFSVSCLSYSASIPFRNNLILIDNMQFLFKYFSQSHNHLANFEI